MLQTLSAALVLAGLTGLTSAPPVEAPDAKLLPASTRFVVHVDVGAIQKSELFQIALGLASSEGEEDPLAGLKQVEAEFGIDPLKDVHSVTLFSAASDPEHAVAMVVGSAKIDDAFTRLAQEEGYLSVEVEGLRLHVMQVEDETIYGYKTARGDRRIVLVSSDRKQLLEGVLVLQGKQPSLADAKAPAVTLAPRPGSFLFVSVAGDLPGLMGVEPVSALVDLARGFTFHLGEREGILEARLDVTTESAETAGTVRDLVQGLVALAHLAPTMEDVPDDLPLHLLDGLEVSVQDRTVTLGFSWATKDLLGIAQGMGALDR